MKTESLQALLTDRELGELEPEVADLLDAHLASSPEARREAEAVARTIASVRDAFRSKPGLAAVRPGPVLRTLLGRPWPRLLAQAAGLVLLLGFGAALGYRAGTSASAVPAATLASAAPAAPAAGRYEGLWTRYQPVVDPLLGLTARPCP